jgi:NAD(P)-dependent dehydrogenase (short-subunit alcohol dehydrogenase family)
MTQLAMPHLMKTQGNVLNVSSTLSVRPAFIGQWYSLSKAALDDYTRVAASMYSMVKVRVNAVRVGAINTKIYAK